MPNHAPRLLHQRRHLRGPGTNRTVKAPPKTGQNAAPDGISRPQLALRGTTWHKASSTRSSGCRDAASFPSCAPRGRAPCGCARGTPFKVGAVEHERRRPELVDRPELSSRTHVVDRKRRRLRECVELRTLVLTDGDDERSRENINREYALTLTELFPTSPISVDDVERYRQKHPLGYGAELTCYQLSKRYGITSFSTRKNDVKMWSHYADHCRGVVIGYNVDLWVRLTLERRKKENLRNAA